LQQGGYFRHILSTVLILGHDLNATLLGAAQKMDQLVKILDEKEDQLMKMRSARESDTAAKAHELEELARKIPGGWT
jgi:hypothetical protein